MGLKIPWIFQESLLLPFHSPNAPKVEDDIDWRYECILNSEPSLALWRFLETTAVAILQKLAAGDDPAAAADSSFRFLHFFLSTTPNIRTILDDARFCHQFNNNVLLTTEKHIRLVIRAHIECGVWTLEKFFTQSHSLGIRCLKVALVNEDFSSGSLLRVLMTDYFPENRQYLDTRLLRFRVESDTLFFSGNKQVLIAMSLFLLTAVHPNASLHQFNVLVNWFAESPSSMQQLALYFLVEDKNHQQGISTLHALIQFTSSLEKLKVIFEMLYRYYPREVRNKLQHDSIRVPGGGTQSFLECAFDRAEGETYRVAVFSYLSDLIDRK